MKLTFLLAVIQLYITVVTVRMQESDVLKKVLS